MSHPDPYRPPQPGPYPPNGPYPPPVRHNSGNARGWRFLDGLLTVLTGVVGKEVGTARDRVLIVLAIFAVVFGGLALVILLAH